MKKILSILLLFIFILNNSNAQINVLGLKANDFIRKNQLEYIDILVKGNKKQIQESCKIFDATIKYNYSNIFALRIAVENVHQFTQSLDKASIDFPQGKGKLLLDTALHTNNVLAVHNGDAPLPQAYTGDGVIVGILDVGIYFNAKDFKKPDGSTRIRYIWDQKVGLSSTAPSPYNYGAEWSWIDINNGVCNHIEPASQYNHGTNVAGIACGNGSATGYFKGVAPESEIIAVAVDYAGNDFLSKFTDAVDYVFKKADALGKACVINASLGTYAGSHDGKDLATQMIEAMLEEKNGRALVAAAGNGNNRNNANASYIPTHLSYAVGADTTFTWFKTIPSENKVYFSLWADTADFKNVAFAFQNDNATTFQKGGRTPFLSIANDFQQDLSNGVLHTEQVFNQANVWQGRVEYSIKATEGRYHVEFLISPDSTQHIWRFMTTGNGTFDVWSSQSFQGSSNMLFENLPPSFVVPEIVHYRYPDNRKTIVSSFQCSDKVITVGNYNSRAYYYDIDSNFHFTHLTQGEIATKSSEGPTRDNRLKPDISATGDITFCTSNPNFLNVALSVSRHKIAFDSLHVRNGGTSMASPFVAGAVALYLQKRPNAPWYEIKEVLLQTAKKDNFTGTTANTHFGYGKLNTFEFLKYNAVLGCMDTSAFNYNPQANIADSSCIAKVYGCTDSTAFNFNANANTNDGSCVPIIYGCTDSTASNFNPQANTNDNACEYETSIFTTENGVKLFLYPNPITAQSVLYFSEQQAQVYLTIYNNLGKEVFHFEGKKVEKIFLNASNWTKGVYFFTLHTKDNTQQNSFKFIVK